MVFVRNIRKFFRVVVKEKNRKPILTLIRECLSLWIRYGSFPMHYFSRYLYIRGKNNIEDYVPNKILYSLWPRFNDEKLIPLLSNKLIFFYYFAAIRINTIEILAYNINHFFYAGNDPELLKDAGQFGDFLLKVMSRLKNKSVYIKKTINSLGGKNIYKIDEGDLPLGNKRKEEIFNTLTQSGYIIQETIKQHPLLEKLNQSCVNTLRIDTFLRKDGTAGVISAYLRYGISGAIVDNTSSGGAQVSIDLHTGRLDKYGYATISDGEGRIYERHPDSGIVFDGYTIPFFAEALDLVRNAAQRIPGLRLVGWDVGITENGPVLIEGNHDYDMTGTDLALYGSLKNPLFREIFQEAGIQIARKRS